MTRTPLIYGRSRPAHSRRRLNSTLSDQAVPVIVAYSANPESPSSVPLIGYRIVHEMHLRHDAHIVAHRRDRDALRRAEPDADFTFVGSAVLSKAMRAITTRLFPGRWGLVSILEIPEYALFDLQAYWAVRRLLKRGRVSYALRVNPVSFRFPSILPFLDTKVVTGPHNGGMEWPEGFRHLEAVEADSTGHVRSVGDILHRFAGDANQYAAILVANPQCTKTVPESARGRTVLMSENGVTQLHTPAPHRGDARRLLFVGRLNPFKATDIAIRALARMPDDVRLTIVGDGNQRAALERLVDELGIRSRVDFVGHVPPHDVAQYYADAGVFLFPSVRESGGGVVLEAMSHGLPCVVADWGGPAVYTKDAGIQCRVDSPQTLEDDIVEALSRLLEDPTSGRELGDASREHIARNYLWPVKVQRIDEICRNVVPPGSSTDDSLRLAVTHGSAPGVEHEDLHRPLPATQSIHA